jgi:hypothetical protein
MFEPRSPRRVEKEILIEVLSGFRLATAEQVHQTPPRKRRKIAGVSS